MHAYLPGLDREATDEEMAWLEKNGLRHDSSPLTIYRRGRLWNYGQPNMRMQELTQHLKPFETYELEWEIQRRKANAWRNIQVCAQCTKRFWPRTSKHRYCSTKCRQEAALC